MCDQLASCEDPTAGVNETQVIQSMFGRPIWKWGSATCQIRSCLRDDNWTKYGRFRARDRNLPYLVETSTGRSAQKYPTTVGDDHWTKYGRSRSRARNLPYLVRWSFFGRRPGLPHGGSSFPNGATKVGLDGLCSIHTDRWVFTAGQLVAVVVPCMRVTSRLNMAGCGHAPKTFHIWVSLVEKNGRGPRSNGHN